MRSRLWFLCVLVLLTACGGLGREWDDPTVDLVALEPLPPEGFEPRFQIQLRFTNPNDRRITVTGLHYVLAVEGHDIASGVVSEPFELPAYGQTTVNSVLQGSVLGSARLTAALLANPARSGLDYAVRVKLSIAGIPLPVRRTVQNRLVLPVWQ